MERERGELRAGHYEELAMRYAKFDTQKESDEYRKKLQEQDDAAHAADPSKPHVIHVPFMVDGKPVETIMDDSPAKLAVLPIGKGVLLTRAELSPVAVEVIKEAPIEEAIEK
jgi:hypothetical protein